MAHQLRDASAHENQAVYLIGSISCAIRLDLAYRYGQHYAAITPTCNYEHTNTFPFRWYDACHNGGGSALLINFLWSIIVADCIRTVVCGSTRTGLGCSEEGHYCSWRRFRPCMVNLTGRGVEAKNGIMWQIETSKLEISCLWLCYLL